MNPYGKKVHRGIVPAPEKGSKPAQSKYALKKAQRAAGDPYYLSK